MPHPTEPGPSPADATGVPEPTAAAARIPEADAAEALELARACARLADEKKAKDIQILDLRGLSPVTSHFVIATGINRRQIHAITEDIVKEVKRRGQLPIGVEGKEEARWVLVDLGDVIIHLMAPEAREYYALEMLWGDAAEVPWQ